MLKKSKSTDKTKDSSIISQSTSNHENKTEQSFITVVNSEAQRRIRQRFSAQKRLALQMGEKPKGLADNQNFELEWTKVYGLEGDPKSIEKRAETIVETDYKEIQSLKKWMNNLKEKTHLSYLGLSSPTKDQKTISLTTYSVLIRNLSLPQIDKKPKDAVENSQKQSQFSQGSRFDRRKTTGPGINSHQAFMSMVNYENEDSESSHMDFSIDGIKRLYQTLIRLNRSEFETEVQRASFYKKQTDLVLTKLQQKIENDIRYRRRVQSTLEQKLKENHDIYTKINQVNDLIETLDIEAEKIKQKPIIEKYQSRQQSSKMIMDTINLQQQQQQQQLLQNEQDHDILRESLQNYRAKHRANKNQIEQLEKFVFIKNKAIKQLKNSQLLFLHHVLEQGMDCRQDGLVWLILKIKKYDSSANLELPIFLDNKAQQFLLKKSEIIASVERLRQTQKSLYEDYQKTREDSLSISRSIYQEFNLQEGQNSPKDDNIQAERFSLMNLGQIKEGILKSKSTKAQKLIEGDLVKCLNTTLRITTEKMIQQLKCQSFNLTKNDLVYLESKKRLREACLQKNNTIKSVESLNAEKDISRYNQIDLQMINLNTELQALEKIESQRISKEFQSRSYQKRFQIAQSTVLAALLGAPRADKEFSRLGLDN